MFRRIVLALAASAAFCVPSYAQCEGSAKPVSLRPTKNIVETAVAAGSFSTLVAAVKAGGLVEALSGKGPFTVFAPTDDAFAKLPKGTLEMLLKPENKQKLADILKFHVVAGQVDAAAVVGIKGAVTLNGQRADVKVVGGKVMIDGAKVVQTDIFCTNGVIHVIDAVILPAGDNIAATATAAGKFGTLLAAVKAAGLVDALTKGGPYTVFAPTDEAFAKLPGGTVETLLKPENKGQLADILKFHIVPGRVYSDAITKPLSPKTLFGRTLDVRPTKTGVMVGNAKVIAADIDASNGVIHVIDTVLLPASS